MKRKIVLEEDSESERYQASVPEEYLKGGQSSSAGIKEDDRKYYFSTEYVDELLQVVRSTMVFKVKGVYP